MRHSARGFFPLMLMLVIAAVLAVMSGMGWLMVHGGFRLGGDKAPPSTTTRASGDLLPEIAGQDVTIPFAHLAFTLPEGWFIYHNWSGIASSTYDQNVREPYASMDIADARGKVVATVVCPPKATGMEQMGDLYDQATSSYRTFTQGTTTYSASFEYVVDYGSGHVLDFSKPRVLDTGVDNALSIVPGFNGELQSCQISDNTDFSQSTIDGIASIYRSWRPFESQIITSPIQVHVTLNSNPGKSEPILVYTITGQLPEPKKWIELVILGADSPGIWEENFLSEYGYNSGSIDLSILPVGKEWGQPGSGLPPGDYMLKIESYEGVVYAEAPFSVGKN